MRNSLICTYNQLLLRDQITEDDISGTSAVNGDTRSAKPFKFLKGRAHLGDKGVSERVI